MVQRIVNIRSKQSAIVNVSRMCSGTNLNVSRNSVQTILIVSRKNTWQTIFDAFKNDG